MMERDFSDSTISTKASLQKSSSSKILRNNSRTRVKASRNSKYKMNGGGGGSRWRAAARGDSGLNSLMKRRQSSRNQSITSNLGRGFEGMKLANSRNEDFNVSEESHDAGHQSPLCIKSVELQRALHRDIDAHSLSDNSTGSKGKERQSSKYEDEKDRWSSKSGGANALSKPKRRGSCG